MKTFYASSGKILVFAFVFCILPTLVLGSWTPKLKLSVNGMSAGLNENMATCLAVSGDTVHVVWSDVRTKGTAIYYIRSVDTGVTWSTTIALTDTTGKATFPAIAVSGNFVHLAWMDESLGHRASFYKRSTDGGATWGPVVILDSNTSFWPGISSSGSLVTVSLNKTIPTNNTEVFFMRSTNNGASWSAEQQISHATNRSEDPCVTVLGQDVYLSWNDKRNGTMLIYFCHSSDGGGTWGAETSLTSSASYTSMVSANGSYVDVPHGEQTGSDFNVWLAQSSDKGNTWLAAQHLTNTSATELYPYMVRDGQNLHLTYYLFGTGGGGWYLHSTNGGTTWDPGVQLSTGGQPFITLSGCNLHYIWQDSGVVYYRRNPTGNGDCSGIKTPGSLKNILGGSLLIDSVIVGYEDCRTDTLINTGDGDVTINSIHFSGSDSSIFSVGGIKLPYILKGHDTVVHQICSVPTRNGLQFSTMIISTSIDGVSKNLSGAIGVYGVLTSGALINGRGSNVNADSVLVGKEICYVDTLTNVSDSDLTVTSLEIIGANAPVFSFKGISTPLTLKAHSAILFTICATPDAMGVREGTLNINAHSADSTMQIKMGIPLEVFGLCARLVYDSPIILDSSSAKQRTFSFQITNTGSIEWNAGVAAIIGSCFKILSLVPANISPGMQMTVTVEFSSNDTNTCSAILSFPSAGPCQDSVVSIQLIGKGTLANSVEKTAEGNFVLDQNFPNPFSGVTSFNYSTPNESEVNIILSDMTGKIVKTIINGKVSEGKHLVTFDASNLPSGSYIISLESGSERLTREVILAK